MAMSRKPNPIATLRVAGGGAQQPEHKVMAEVPDARLKAAEAAAVLRGRRRTFKEPTTRFNFFLPASLVKAVRQDALDAGKTASEIIAAILQSQYQVGAKAKP
jgi:hypothetical protein